MTVVIRPDGNQNAMTGSHGLVTAQDLKSLEIQIGGKQL